MTEYCHTINLVSGRQMPQPGIRVIGIGSAHGVDQIGWLACERLQTLIKTHQIDWQLCRTPAQLPQLAADCDAVIIIDAIISEDPAGQVISLTWPVRQEQYDTGYSSHSFNVLEALQLVSTLGQLPAHTYLLGVAVTHPEHEAMPIVENAVPQLQHKLNCIVNMIDASRTRDL